MVEFKERLEKFQERYKNKDYLLMKVTQEQGKKVGFSSQETVEALLPFFANSSVDFNSMIKLRKKQGAKIIAGNFINLKDPRVHELKDYYDAVSEYLPREFEASSKVIAESKTDEKIEEAKKRLNK